MLTNSREGDIINQYVMFTHILNEQIKKYGRTKEAIDETIKICKDRNILKEYLSNHESEVHDIMFSLYDDEQIQKAMMREHEKIGETRGRMEGIDAMIANLKNLGVSEEVLRNAANMSQSQRP